MHPFRHFRGLLAALSVALAVGCSESPPSNQGDDESAASMARAVEITSRMLEAYRAADSYADHATYVEESVLRGEGVAREFPYYQMSLAFERPNRLRLTFTESIADSSGARQGFDVASDGSFVRATLPEIPDQMVEKPAPAAFTPANVLPDPLIRQRLLVGSLSEVFPQLAMLLNESDDDQAAVFVHDDHPRMLADAELDGRVCFRVATSNPAGTRILWIDAETYALRRMELPVETIRQEADPKRNFLRFSVRIDVEDATFNAEIDESSFTLAPRPGARRVRRFVLPAETDEATAKDAKSARDDDEVGEEDLEEDAE